MKQRTVIALLVLIFCSFKLTAKEFKSVWANDCKNPHAITSKLIVSHDGKNGFFQVSQTENSKSRSLDISTDKSFKIIDHNSLLYKKVRFYRCTNEQTKNINAVENIPNKSQILEDQIQNYLLSGWEENKQSQVFIDKKDKTGLVHSDVNKEHILVKLKELRLLKLEFINEKERNMIFEVKPDNSAFINYNFGDEK